MECGNETVIIDVVTAIDFNLSAIYAAMSDDDSQDTHEALKQLKEDYKNGEVCLVWITTLHNLHQRTRGHHDTS